jgi:hypothetical protein
MTPALLAAKVMEGDAVRRWRSEQLIRAGFSPLDALVLSGRGDVDLQLAVSLLRKGCRIETALQILL